MLDERWSHRMCPFIVNKSSTIPFSGVNPSWLNTLIRSLDSPAEEMKISNTRICRFFSENSSAKKCTSCDNHDHAIRIRHHDKGLPIHIPTLNFVVLPNHSKHQLVSLQLIPNSVRLILHDSQGEEGDLKHFHFGRVQRRDVEGRIDFLIFLGAANDSL